jgi:histidine triad (HIT) family protein
MSECNFCAIVQNRIEAHIVYEDEECLAFLDHRPLFPGHSLLVPRTHYETLSDLPVDLVGPFFSATQLLARAVETAMEAQGTFVALNNKVSQSVPHVHVHVVPRRRKDGLRGFFWPRRSYRSQEEMQLAAQRVRAAAGNDRS